MNHLLLDNIIFSLQKSGGISVVWYNIINACIKSKIDVSYLEYEGCNDNIFRKKLNLERIKKSSDSFINLKRYCNPRIKEKEPFLFHSSYYRTCDNRNAINITTVHDFTYELFAKGISRFVHTWQKFRAIRNSDIVAHPDFSVATHTDPHDRIN